MGLQSTIEATAPTLTPAMQRIAKAIRIVDVSPPDPRLIAGLMS